MANVRKVFWHIYERSFCGFIEDVGAFVKVYFYERINFQIYLEIYFTVQYINIKRNVQNFNYENLKDNKMNSNQKLLLGFTDAGTFKEEDNEEKKGYL